MTMTPLWWISLVSILVLCCSKTIISNKLIFWVNELNRITVLTHLFLSHFSWAQHEHDGWSHSWLRTTQGCAGSTEKTVRNCVCSLSDAWATQTTLEKEILDLSGISLVKQEKKSKWIKIFHVMFTKASRTVHPCPLVTEHKVQDHLLTVTLWALSSTELRKEQIS